MTTEFVSEYLDKKINENENYIVATYYDVMVRNGVRIDEEDKFLELAKIRLENMNYNVFFTGVQYTYNNTSKTVQDNELLVAIKDLEN